MASRASQAGSSAPLPERIRAVAVPLVFAGLAVVLFAGPWRFHNPTPPPVPVPNWAVNPEPVRKPKLAPYIEVAGRRYQCSDCHKRYEFDEDPPLLMHEDIVLAHGINNRCLNCHHATNRDMLAGNREEEIPYDQPQLLCAKCHGPVYRDWLNRAHGRTNGYWSSVFGPVERTKCIQCHDPHQPPFPPMRPAPPPLTLRMGPQDHFEDAAEVGPLRVFGPFEEELPPPEAPPPALPPEHK